MTAFLLLVSAAHADTTLVVQGSDGLCEAVDEEVTVTVTQPPQGFFDCKDAKPIDELSMEWAGSGRRCVRTMSRSMSRSM